MAKEGSTEAPVRHPIDFNHPDFLDSKKLAVLEGTLYKIWGISTSSAIFEWWRYKPSCEGLL